MTFFNSFFSSPIGVVRYFYPAAIVPYLLGVILVLLWPSDLNIDYAFFEWMTSNIPSIAAAEKKSNFSNTSLAYFSLSSIIYLPWLIVLLKNEWWLFGSPEKLSEFYEKVRNKKFPLIFCLFAIVLFLFAVYVAWNNSAYQYAIFPIHEKKVALAIFGPFASFFCVAYFMIGAAFVYVGFILKILQNKA